MCNWKVIEHDYLQNKTATARWKHDNYVIMQAMSLNLALAQKENTS